MADASEERSLPASQRKLQKAREKGQVMASADFVAGAVTVAGALYVVLNFGAFASFVTAAYASALRLVAARGTYPLAAALQEIAHGLAGLLAPLVLVVAAVAVVANIAHKRGLVVSAHPLKPDANRLSPTEGLKRMFGMRNGVELAIALLRVSIWIGVVVTVVWLLLPAALNGPVCGLPCLVEQGADGTRRLVIAALILLILMAILDLPVQAFLFARDMRMSHRELKRELRETEGAPEFEGHRREEHREMATGAGGGLKRANFVVVSAAAALALRYDEGDTPVPVVLAKGRGTNADRIVEAARRLGLPILQEPDIANYLQERVPIGGMVPRESFNAVAMLVLRVRAA